MENERKKLLVLRIFDVLRLYSDETCPLTYEKITDHLSRYNVTCDRKTIARNIKFLTEYGYEIKKHPYRSGIYYTGKHTTPIFSHDEVASLVACIMNSSEIKVNQAQSLIEKITAYASDEDKSEFRNILDLNSRIE